MFIILDTYQNLTHRFDQSETPLFDAAGRLHGLVGNGEFEQELHSCYRTMNARLRGGRELWIELDAAEVHRLHQLLDLAPVFARLCEPPPLGQKQSYYRVVEKWRDRVIESNILGLGRVPAHKSEHGRHLMNTASWIRVTQSFFGHAIDINGTVAWFDGISDTAELMGWRLNPWSKI